MARERGARVEDEGAEEDELVAAETPEEAGDQHAELERHACRHVRQRRNVPPPASLLLLRNATQR